MSGRYHFNLRTAVVFFLLLFMHLDVCNCLERFEIIRQKVKEICDSKSNITKDCGGKPSCPHRFTTKTACWERTCADEKATSPCPMIFFYTNVSSEAFCDHNGSWNFSQTKWREKCTALTPEERKKVVDVLLGRQKEESSTERYQLKVYVTFSWISFSFMIPTLFVLFYFMDRKNIRFNLHKNLICAFLFRVVTFFVDHYGDLIRADRTICNAFWVLNRFFAISEVTWMLNEAIFLLKLLFRTFDAKSYFWGFFAFGWGFPAILVFAIYIPVMVYYVDKEMKICWSQEKDSWFMFILYGPMTLMLLINFATLIYVIYVLLDKLRTSTTSDLLRLKKGIKAALILMPLLGVIYLMILYVPTTAPTWYNYLIRILYPMQGTLACLVYVVFNGEVRQAIKTRWNRWLHTKSEFLERRGEITNFLNGEVVDGQKVNNDAGVLKQTAVVHSDSRGFTSNHLKKELTYDKNRNKLKKNVSPTTPVSSDGGDQERPLFPTEEHRR